MFNGLVLVAQIRKSASSQFNLVLDPDSEVLRLSLVVIPLELNLLIDFRVVDNTSAFNKLLIESLSNIKFNGIISSSNGLNVPFDKVVSLNAPDVVNINKHKKSNKHSNTSVIKTDNLSI